MKNREALLQTQESVTGSLKRFFRMLVPYNSPHPECQSLILTDSAREWLGPQDIADMKDYFNELPPELDEQGNVVQLEIDLHSSEQTA